MTDGQLFRIRDIIVEVGNTRRGLVLTDAVIRDLANNAAQALMFEFVIQAERGNVVHGTIEADRTARAVPGQDVISDEPPPVRTTNEGEDHA